MLHRNIVFGMIAALSASCAQQAELVLTNASDQSLQDKRMILKRETLTGLKSEYLKLKAEGVEIPVQFDDLNGDGKWDELVFEASFLPGQKLSLVMEEASELPNYPARSNAYLGVSEARNNQFTSVSENVRPSDHVAMSTPYLYQFEGPAWESDLVAFRTYFDSRNGKDIFGKTTREMCAHQIGTGEDYHSLQSWGMDVLKVGGSLGAGALAVLKDDSVFRLGATEGAAFKIISEGPVRSIIELKYTGWNVAGTNYDITEQITIWAGKRSYESAVTLYGSGADTLVTGIVNLKKVPRAELTGGEYQIQYTHGEQSENHDILGMATLVSNVNFISYKDAPNEGNGVSNTYMVYLKPVDGVYTFHFVAGWELENQAFHDARKFEESLVAEATELSKNIEINITY